jgi:hypothetical protein
MVILNHGAGMSSSPLEGLVIIILLLQFFVGIVELVIALVLTVIALTNKKNMRGLSIYWILVFVYFLGLGVFGALSQAYREFPEEIGFAWFFLAWGIAIYMPFHKRFNRVQQPVHNQINPDGFRPEQHTNNS